MSNLNISLPEPLAVEPVVESLIEDRLSIESGEKIAKARELFCSHQQLLELPVTQSGKPVGRLVPADLLRASDDSNSIETIMKTGCPSVDRNHTVASLIQAISEDLFHRVPVVHAVVDADGHYLGRFNTTKLLHYSAPREEVFRLFGSQLNTGLPSETELLEQTRTLVAQRQLFVIAGINIAGFKAFNARYGQERGEEAIRSVASLLREHLDQTLDFVAHVSGDNFIVLFRSIDWFDRCEALIGACDAQAPGYYDIEDRRKGGIEDYNYLGERNFTPIFSLSIGVTQVEPGKIRSAESLLAQAHALKRRRSSLEGGTILVDGFSHDAIQGTLGLVQH